jgi:hypothetical protein
LAHAVNLPLVMKSGLPHRWHSISGEQDSLCHRCGKLSSPWRQKENKGKKKNLNNQAAFSVNQPVTDSIITLRLRILDWFRNYYDISNIIQMDIVFKKKKKQPPNRKQYSFGLGRQFKTFALIMNKVPQPLCVRNLILSKALHSISRTKQ